MSVRDVSVLWSDGLTSAVPTITVDHSGTTVMDKTGKARRQQTPARPRRLRRHDEAHDAIADSQARLNALNESLTAVLSESTDLRKRSMRRTSDISSRRSQRNRTLHQISVDDMSRAVSAAATNVIHGATEMKRLYGAMTSPMIEEGALFSGAHRRALLESLSTSPPVVRAFGSSIQRFSERPMTADERTPMAVRTPPSRPHSASLKSMKTHRLTVVNDSAQRQTPLRSSTVKVGRRAPLIADSSLSSISVASTSFASSAADAVRQRADDVTANGRDVPPPIFSINAVMQSSKLQQRPPMHVGPAKVPPRIIEHTIIQRTPGRARAQTPQTVVTIGPTEWAELGIDDHSLGKARVRTRTIRTVDDLAAEKARRKARREHTFALSRHSERLIRRTALERALEQREHVRERKRHDHSRRERPHVRQMSDLDLENELSRQSTERASKQSRSERELTIEHSRKHVPSYMKSLKAVSRDLTSDMIIDDDNDSKHHNKKSAANHAHSEAQHKKHSRPQPTVTFSPQMSSQIVSDHDDDDDDDDDADNKYASDDVSDESLANRVAAIIADGKLRRRQRRVHCARSYPTCSRSY